MKEEYLSYAEARKLVDSGEWMFDGQLWPHLEALVQSRLDIVLNDEQVRQQVLEPAKPIIIGDTSDITPELEALLFGTDEDSPPEMVVPRLNATLHELRDYVQATAESRWYEVPADQISYNPWLSEMRVGVGKILKIGPTIKLIFWDMLALIGTLLSVADWDIFILLTKGMNEARKIPKIVNAIRQSYVQLDDAKERFVFEVVALIQARKTRLVNYDALAAGDYDAAYGQLAPTTDDIVQEIAHYPLSLPIPDDWRQHSPAAWRDDLQMILNNLKAREILQQRNGRWSIVF